MSKVWRFNYWKKIISGLMAFIFAVGSVGTSYAQSVVQMPAPGTMMSLSEAFAPPLLKGVKVYPDNPFRLDFILDKGNSSGSTEQLKAESTRLIKYFLASITVPEKDLWVNLSPYEKDRIVPDAFGVTEMGRDLLAQDYMLKKITASVIYPEGEVGKAFWAKVYAEAQKRFGTSDVPVDTFNKVWIVPEKAVVYESMDSAYVVESRLKVMLEEDYLALNKNTAAKERGTTATNKLGSDIVRDVVIPILEKEVNEGRNFAQLRQVYQSLILAVWYKDKVKESIFGKAYVDRNKTGGVDIEDRAAKDKIWAQYVEAFKKGAYNYIKEDLDPATQQAIPRKYFSGGNAFFEIRKKAYKLYDSTTYSGHLPDGVPNSAMIVESNFAPVDMAMKIEKQELVRAANALSVQDGNVVLERNSNSGKWQFRRSSLSIEVPQSVVDRLGSQLEKEGKQRILFAFRNHESRNIEEALERVSAEQTMPVQEIFNSAGIDSFYDYKRVILVPSYGDAEGRPLVNVVPAEGVEIIAYALNRSLNNVDALVYNPNLTSPDDLYSFIEREKPDIVAKSVLETTFMRDIELVSRMWKLSPKSLFLVGGPNMSDAPHQDLFDSLHIDGIVTGGVGAFVDIVSNVSAGLSKAANQEQLAQSKNIITVDDQGRVRPVVRQSEQPLDLKNPYADIPRGVVDVTHQKAYPTADNFKSTPVARGQLGFRPLRVAEDLLGNHCKGNCIFCQLHKIGSMDPLPPEVVVARIKERYNPEIHDSIYFGAWDIFDDLSYLKRLANLIEQDPVLRAIPKRASGRVDNIGDGSIFDDLKRAGFKFISFGVETYDDRALKRLGKGATYEQEIFAIETCLRVGIMPTIYQILFSPGKTLESIREDINHTMEYIEKGASVSVVPALSVIWGTPFSRMVRDHHLEKYFFDGMKKSMLYPTRIKHADEYLENLEQRMMVIADELSEDPRYPSFARRSLNFYGLTVFKSFYLALQEMVPGEQKPGIAEQIRKIEISIAAVLDEEASSLATYYYPEIATKYCHRKDLQIRYDSDGRLVEDTILLDDGVLIRLRRNSADENIFDVYSVVKDEKIGEVRFEDVVRSQKVEALVIPNVVDRTGFLQTALFQWADRMMPTREGAVPLRAGSSPNQDVLSVGHLIGPVSVSSADLKAAVPDQLLQIIASSEVEIVLGNGHSLQGYLALREQLGSGMVHHEDSEMPYYVIDEGKHSRVIIPAKDQHAASAIYWRLQAALPGHSSILLRNLLWREPPSHREVNTDEARIMSVTKNFIWDQLLYAIKKIDVKQELSGKIEARRDEVFNYLKDVNPHDVSPYALSTYFENMMLICCDTLDERKIVETAVRGIPFYRLFFSQEPLLRTAFIKWQEAPLTQKTVTGYDQEVNAIDMNALLAFWKQEGVVMHVVQPLGPVTHVLDRVSDKDEMIFTDGSVDTLKEILGSFASIEEVMLPQSSFGKRILLAYRADGSRVLVFSELPGKAYNWHWQLMVKAYLQTKGVAPSVKTVQTQIKQVNYDRVVNFFNAYAEYLRDATTVVIAPPRIFSAEWERFKLRTIDDESLGVRVDLYQLPNDGKIAVVSMRHSFHGEILARNMDNLIAKYPSIKNVFFYQTAGFLGKFSGHYAVYPSGVLLPNGSVAPNTLSEKGRDEFLHSTVFSVLEETPATILGFMGKGVKSLDMELGYLADVLSKRNVGVGFGLVIVDAVTISEGTENTGGWGDSYFSENEVSFPTKVLEKLARPGKADAMNSDLGGIDLSRDKMGLQVQNGGQGVQFKFDPAMIQQLQNAAGLTPIIIDIRPMITTVPIFLGLNDKADRMVTELTRI
ncbi:MAG: radical SAM protein [Desulfobulbaceae bacterium]|nr:radical SAM protein [Desulfobulbaceae bacterium]